MKTLSLSSFLPIFSPSLDVSLARTRNKPQINFIANSSLVPFNSIKKLITQRFSHKTSQKQSIVQHGTKRQSLHELIFKPLDNIITTFINDLPLPPGIDPKHILTGNFSPVDEIPPTACDVAVGPLPPCLDGAYIQNTANPQFAPRGPYHLADGDGMLHSVRISNGKATFCSRYVKTYKYVLERDLGYPVIPNFIASFVNKRCFEFSFLASIALYVARIVTGQINPYTEGIGTANTSLALFGGHLLALVEHDMPYSIKLTPNGDIITIGRHNFHGDEPITNITAHPKIDPETGEVFAFRYSGTKPYLTYFTIDPNGTKKRDVPISSLETASLVHDFAVTRRFAVFPNTQIVSNPSHVIRGESIIAFDRNKVARLGVVPRYAEDEREMWWMEEPGLNMVHVVNGWEEGEDGERVVIMAANAASFEHMLEKLHLVHVSLEMIVIDTEAKKVVMRRPVSGRSLEFGVINPRYDGKKNRYIFAAEMEANPKISGVVKVDLSLLSADCGDCVVASRMYGPGCYGSQPIFVAREADNPAADEDDGYLLSYVHNENTHESHFLVMDAKSPSLDVVAAVKLPRRVPYGFHSIFVHESDLLKL